MRLFIAEKPSLASAIADGLGSKIKKNGFFSCGDDAVTWCFGHLLELYNPEEYDPNFKSWKKDTLPIIPEEWKKRPKYSVGKKTVDEGVQNQINIIKNLLNKASVAINAGDPDREGQLLVDELLEYLQWKGNTQRIWVNANDLISMKKALANLRDNAEFVGLRDAAEARSKADWLVGINLTRAMTIFGRSYGSDSVLSQGRVQTPTLAIVVNRDADIASFTPHDYYTLDGVFTHARGTYTGTLQIPKDLLEVDPEGRIINREVAERLAGEAKGEGVVLQAEKTIKKKSPPLPYSLASLQKAASSKYSMSAKTVLDTAQSLYEKKLTSYPRSDCQYLPDEQFNDGTPARILQTLSQMKDTKAWAEGADSKRKSPAWNTKKITAHHAIIPTGEKPGILSAAEAKIFSLIAQSYCIQFYEDYQYEAQKIVTETGKLLWNSNGRKVLVAGWMGIKGKDEDDNEEKSLPELRKGDKVQCSDVAINTKKTEPPKKFTEGSLIEAMEDIHKYITGSEDKAILKKAKGIGTEATRANIIETLKKRGFIEAAGRNLVSTKLGQDLIALTPPELKDPVTTAHWESRLTDIVSGEEKLSAFLGSQETLLPGLIKAIFEQKVKAGQSSFNTDMPLHSCPVCEKMLKKVKSKKNGKLYWVCSDKECGFITGDDKGKPAEQKKTDVACPKCGKPLIWRDYKKGGFWTCSGYPDCTTSYDDDGGKPLILGDCPECGRPLRRKTSAKGPFIGCSGYPECTYIKK